MVRSHRSDKPSWSNILTVELTDAGFQLTDTTSHVCDDRRLLSDDVIVLVAATSGAQLLQFRRRRRLAHRNLHSLYVTPASYIGFRPIYHHHHHHHHH